MFKWSRNPRIYKYQLNRKNIIFRFFFLKKNVEITMYKKIQYSCFFDFFFEKIYEIPIFKVCEKMMLKILICRNLNFCFQKMQFLDTTEIINTFVEIDIMHGEKRNFFGIFSFIFTMVDKSKFHFFQPFLP